MQRIFKLKGKVQHYDWGGYNLIPGLLGVENSVKKPYAEYWLGAHPANPAVLEEVGVNLQEWLQQHGSYELPFLMKVLDVRNMLSIQLHPSKKMAEQGFADENKKGISMDAPYRNYKDANHKPELMVALGPFWLLHGFKPEEELLETLNRIPEFISLKEVFVAEGYAGLYSHAMTMPQAQVDEILSALASRILPDYQSNRLNESAADFWAAKAMETYCKDGHYDRGIFSVYFLNLLRLNKGEGIFQPAGMLHAYLHGYNVEIMATSDNVIRGGLTSKHIDIEELLKNVLAEPTIPEILRQEGDDFFKTSATEFRLKHLIVSGEKQFSSTSPEILLVVDGTAFINDEHYGRGDAAFVLPETEVRISSEGESEIFRAFHP